MWNFPTDLLKLRKECISVLVSSVSCHLCVFLVRFPVCGHWLIVFSSLSDNAPCTVFIIRFNLIDAVLCQLVWLRARVQGLQYLPSCGHRAYTFSSFQCLTLFAMCYNFVYSDWCLESKVILLVQAPTGHSFPVWSLGFTIFCHCGYRIYTFSFFLSPSFQIAFFPVC